MDRPTSEVVTSDMAATGVCGGCGFTGDEGDNDGEDEADRDSEGVEVGEEVQDRGGDKNGCTCFCGRLGNDVDTEWGDGEKIRDVCFSGEEATAEVVVAIGPWQTGFGDTHGWSQAAGSVTALGGSGASGDATP